MANDLAEKQLGAFLKRASRQLDLTEEYIREKLKEKGMGYNPSVEREAELMIFLRNLNAQLIVQEEKIEQREKRLYPEAEACPYHPEARTQGTWWGHMWWFPIWECGIGGTLCYWLSKVDKHRKTQSNFTLLQEYISTNPSQISGEELAKFREEQNEHNRVLAS
jgi:hypothetical protein